MKRLCIVFALGLLLPATSAEADKAGFKLMDARGDDHGNGLFEYPNRTEFEKGDLDLVSLKARPSKSGTWFEATFANPVKKAGREAIDDLGTQLDTVARYGFYTLNLDIYIDKDRQPESGSRKMIPGRLAELQDDAMWEKAIILTPRPNLVRSELKRLMAKEFHEYAREQDPDARPPARKELVEQIDPELEDSIFFPKQVRVRGRTVSFFVPGAFLGGPASPDWGYVVAVSGANLLQTFDLSAALDVGNASRKNLGIIPVSPGRWNDRFGGGREDSPNQPPLVDILVPEGESQEELLRNFDASRDRAVRLPAVVPSEVPSKVSSKR